MQLDFLSLFSIVVSNAQRATWEIADGIDITSMSDMIQGVRLSVMRARELVENLVAHSNPDKDADDH
jgi:hypothetical protein